MRKPIRYNFDDGQFLYATLTHVPHIRIAVEWPNGTHYADWSLYGHSSDLSPNEFVARTWGDTRGLMASAMLGTGWFVRTGRGVITGSGEPNEVWRLSDLGEEWASSMQSEQLGVTHG